MWLAREARALISIIPREEKIYRMAIQRRLDNALLNPSITVATEKKLVVCNRSFLGIRHDITFIPYKAIVSMRMVNGLFFSSLHLRLHGTAHKNANSSSDIKEDGEISGLRQADAIALARAISISMERMEIIKKDKKAEASGEEKVQKFISEGEAYSEAEMEYVLNDSEVAVQLPPHVYPSDLRIFKERKLGEDKGDIDPDELMVFKLRR